MPVTLRWFGFEVALPEGLGVTGVVPADQVNSLDWQARKAARIGAVPGDVMTRVLLRLNTLLAEDASRRAAK